MSRITSTGSCNLCGKSFSRASMTRHLKTCAQPKAAADRSAQAKTPPGRCFHLFVDGKYAAAYWMHLAVPVDFPLESLDGFLHRTWLECCGHLSAFTIAGERYTFSSMGEFDEPDASPFDFPFGPRRKIRKRSKVTTLNQLLKPGTTFYHEYDFGTPTELELKVLALWDRATPEDDIEMLARNDAPQVACDRCGKQAASEICTECAWSGKGWLCKPCAARHKCASEMFLPVVNSPRVGQCGYCG